MTGVWGESAIAGWQHGEQMTIARQARADSEYETAILLTQRLQKGYREYQESEAHADLANVEAAKILYEMNTGNPFPIDGTNKAAAQYGIDEMGRVNHSFFQAGEGAGMVSYLSKIGDASDLQKLAFLHWVESYDAMDADNWNELGRFAKSAIKDPTNYVGVSALAGYAIKLGGKKLGKSAAIESIKSGLKLTAAGSFEGAVFGGAADTTIQQSEINASDNPYHQERTEQDMTQTAATTAVGSAIGAAIPNTASLVKGLTNKVTGWIKPKKEEVQQ